MLSSSQQGGMKPKKGKPAETNTQQHRFKKLKDILEIWDTYPQ